MKETSINWGRFTEQLSEEVTASQASNDFLALILVSIKDLGIYNFRLGFHRGEMIVARLVEHLSEIMPRARAITRIAPDRIAVIVSQTTIPELLSISAQKLVDRLAEPFLVENEIVSVATSLGISLYPEHGDTAEALMSEAELSLLSVSQDVKSFHITTHVRSDKHLTMLQMGSDLQNAIADEKLTLHYQPKVDLQTLLPVSSEALMRWTSNDGIGVSPEEFIPIAETSETIFRLTEWAINTALREGGEVNGQGTEYAVAVNLSAGIIYEPSVVSIVESALASWRLPARLLTLEVTESSLIKNPELCFRHLSMIRDKGVKVSIDDFGTGFSSLSYFRHIPADEIKIDQSFIKRMCENLDDEKIVGLIIDLAHTFDLKVVAEGIEDEATLRKLQGMSCDVGQGYYFSKPLTLETYKKWLKDYSV